MPYNSFVNFKGKRAVRVTIYDIFLVFVAVVFVIALAVSFFLIIRGQYARSDAILKSWAKGNGYEILSMEKRLLCPASVLWTIDRWRPVYFIKVRKPDGEIRHGWVRCGDFVLPTFADSVQVRWDDWPPPTSKQS
jgi:hypothetical protein